MGPGGPLQLEGPLAIHDRQGAALHQHTPGLRQVPLTHPGHQNMAALAELALIPARQVGLQAPLLAEQDPIRPPITAPSFQTVLARNT